MTKEHKVSVCIACHNQAHFLGEALVSTLKQDYPNFEIIVLDDASTDNPRSAILPFPEVKMFRSEEPSGSGGAFNKAISYATGKYIVLLCADDIFNDTRVLSDIAKGFNDNPTVAHISRYYHQFEDGDPKAVRAWRTNNIIELANNPSGLAFRATSLKRQTSQGLKTLELTNDMFVEAPNLVYQVMIDQRNLALILPYDTVKIRIHQSTARNSFYYRKMWKTSPVEAWSKIGGSALQRDYTSLIQIKNYFTTWAVVKECMNFIKLRSFNIVEPGFWFFALVSIFTPRFILMRVPVLYRRTIGRWTTKECRKV